jgi:hypothetical protein
MTQDEIIEMAKQAGFGIGLDDPIIYAAHERFAKLVAQHERTKLQGQIETLYAMYELASKQRDYLMEQQNAQVAAMRGKMQ